MKRFDEHGSDAPRSGAEKVAEGIEPRSASETSPGASFETDDAGWCAALEAQVRTLRDPAPHDPFRNEPALALSIELASGVLNAAPNDSKSIDLHKADARAESATREIGTYFLLEPIGRGGMGTVYRAVHTQLDKQVAIKVLATDRLNSREMVDRFRREMKAIGRFDHPHLIRALDAGEEAGTHFLVMEYVAGIDLQHLLKRVGPLRIPDACAIAVQAAHGLHAAHARGIVHRDVKPANLMLAAQEAGPPLVKVLDLGVASLAGSISESGQQMTRDGQILGTIEYMAPEQADRRSAVDLRADIWSLGATLYALLTGNPVFDCGETQSVLQKLSALANDSVPPLSRRRLEVSESLAAVVHRMLARKPAERYGSLAEVASALQPFAAGADLTALLARGTNSTNESTPSRSVPAAAPARAADPPSVSCKPPRRIWPSALIAAGLAVLAAVLVTVRTSTGDVIVEVPDDVPPEVAKQLQIEVSGDKEIRVADAKTGWTIHVKEGTYNVQLNGGGDQFEITGDRVTVTRDQKAIVQVTRKPPAVLKSGPYTWPANTPRPAIAPFDAAQARKHQDEWARHLGLPREFTNAAGMRFVLIPPGEFRMGSTTEEIEELIETREVNDDDRRRYLRSEIPQHVAVITQPFYLAVHELTQKQYATLMGKNPSYYAATHPDAAPRLRERDTSNFPVETVSWDDAARFCLALSRSEGIAAKDIDPGSPPIRIHETSAYRLPTEAEWEMACRAGTTTPYWSGASDADLAGSEWSILTAEKEWGPRDVGTVRANPYGLFDMLGNVDEMVRDEGYRFTREPAIDPKGRKEAGTCVVKGGSFAIPTFECRSARRAVVVPYGPIERRGFRIALSVESVRQLQKVKSEKGTSSLPTDDAEFAQNRRAAEWVLSLKEGSTVSVTEPDGTSRAVAEGESLPSGPFRLEYANISWRDKPAEELVPTLADRLRGVRPTRLGVRRESLTAAEAAKLVALPELAEVESLGLSASLIDDRMLFELAKLPKLRFLDLDTATGVTGEGLAALKACEHLASLTLLFSRVNPEDLGALQFLRGLTYLNLDGTPLSERHLAAISRLKLTHLLLGNGGLDDAKAAKLSGLRGLVSLELNNNPLTDKGLENLKPLTGLKNLVLTGTATTAAGIADLRKALPDCEIVWEPRVE